MIVSKTPLRISFVGGGSDLPSFYHQSPGAVVSTTINKYMYLTVNKKFDPLIRVSYSITEMVKKPEELKHELVRESLLFLNLNGGLEITSISDIPSRGTGLGSSSAYTVGLLNALYTFKGKSVSADKLAQEACLIEMDRCQKPVGKQDQYAAAFGNLNYLQFNSDESVLVEPIACHWKTKARLERNLLLLYTGLTRSSSVILKDQSQGVKRDRKKFAITKKMVSLARQLKAELEKNLLDNFGQLLHENWELKKQLAEGVSSQKIDRWYQKARENGALGGKILGAGGGGFLLLYAPKEKHPCICEALPKLRPVPFTFDSVGSKIIYP